MTGQPQRRYTVDDYHRIEETSPVRHEFHAGEIFAMTGGTVAHNHISANVLAVLRSALVSAACSAFGSDMRLHTPSGLLTYPDVMVICGPIELAPGRKDEVTNPVLIVEVLSEATRHYDRGDKFDLYKAIPTFREYLLIEQDRVGVEQHRRAGDSWGLSTFESIDQTLVLESVPVELSLADMYRKVFD